MSGKQLVIFDFDWSLADSDSDEYILEVLAPDLRRKMESLIEEGKMEWIEIVTTTITEMQARGITREQMERTLRALPFHPAMVRAVRNLKSKAIPQTTFFCLSNANSVYIRTILEEHGLIDAFDEIVTNRAEWDENGRLNIRPRLDPEDPYRHVCQIGCEPNMCKGEELDAFIARHDNEVYDKIIYVGDGGNDFCPILGLRTQDLALVRKGRRLEGKINEEGKAKGLKCEVVYWAGAWEIEELFAAI